MIKTLMFLLLRDNVVWEEEQEEEARAKIHEQMKHPASVEDTGAYSSFLLF